MAITTDGGSTVPRRQLGRYLRRLREQAGIAFRPAAEALEWPSAKLWRIETGQTPMRSLDVEAMCRRYGASAELTEALMGMAKETRAKGWWHSYGDAIPAWFDFYLDLESAACRQRQYAPELIPNHLQTKEYAAQVFRLTYPYAGATDVERGVALRLARQSLLTRPVPAPPLVEVILNEAALRRSIADPTAMATQLRCINGRGALPNVSVRVLTLDSGLHRAALSGGGFVILDFPPELDNDPEPTTVYSDGVTGALYLDKPHEVAAYQGVWSDLVARCLDEPASRHLISAIANQYDPS